jgi:uncharacterized protein YceH (UPF0502 family)
LPRRDPTRRTTRKGRLVDRVIRQRRDAKQEAGFEAGEGADDQRRIAALERRVDELEARLEGLRDSVDRDRPDS